MSIFKPLLPMTAALALCSCGGDSGPENQPDSVPVESFEFFRGRWDVLSRFVLPDGSTDESTATAVVESEFSDVVLKETVTGTRNGEPMEWMTMRAQLRGGSWLVARADAALGTFDVLQGAVTDRVGQFVSNRVTRPDGGVTRATWSDFDEDATRFTVTFDRAASTGGPFETFWTLEYARNDAATAPAADTITSTCTTERHRAFDFWVGRWQTFSASGAPNAPSTINRLLGDCVIEENWMARGGPGTSLNMYDRRTDLWYQVWIDSSRGSAILSGSENEEGEMFMTRGPTSGGGGTTLDEWRWTPLEDGTVQQVGRTSNNGGSTWTTVADLNYRPR